jgi:hypothetical protein
MTPEICFALKNSWRCAVHSKAVVIGILLLFGTYAFAEPQPVAVKDWTFIDTGGGTGIAKTINDSGSVLGIYCAALKNCDAYLISSMTCEVGSKYPGLINAGSGSFSISVTCKNIAADGEKPNYAFVFAEFDLIRNLMLKDHSVGVALPLANGQFKVTRFSLEGSNETLAAVGRAISNGTKQAKAKQAKDETI